MKQRGRKSASEMAVVSEIVDSRPNPPDDLTKEQKAIWRAVVNSKPQDWFKADTHELLAAYCRHVTAAKYLSKEVDELQQGLAKPEDQRPYCGMDRLIKLLRSRDSETKAMVNLARSMRITQHSLLRAETAATKTNNTSRRKIWE